LERRPTEAVPERTARTARKYNFLVQSESVNGRTEAVRATLAHATGRGDDHLREGRQSSGMSEATPGERVALPCPACSPDLETVHEVLKPGGHVTVRCTECDHVHKEQLSGDSTVERNVVVSQEDESFTATVDVPEDATLAVGEEFLLETEEAVMSVRITSLETDDGREEEADIDAVQTIWTRAVGNVAVNVTMHPKDGRHDETESFKLQVPGDYEFVVGETDGFGEEEFTVEGIHVRDDAHGYDHENMDHDGDAAVAKDINRLYVRDESTTAWSAW